MPRAPPDSADDLRKQTLSQLVFGQLNNEVPGMSNEAPAGLEEPLLEAREGPALDGKGQNQPAQAIAEIVGDDAEQQAHFVRPKPMTGEPSQLGGGSALLDPGWTPSAAVTRQPRAPCSPE